MASCSPLLLLVLCALTVAEAQQLKVFNLRASNLELRSQGTLYAYVKVFYGSTILGQTSVHNNNQNPRWDEEFTHVNARENEVIKLEVYAHVRDQWLDNLVGVCRRQIKLGTHEHECVIEEGGTLNYTYTLG